MFPKRTRAGERRAGGTTLLRRLALCRLGLILRASACQAPPGRGGLCPQGRPAAESRAALDPTARGPASARAPRFDCSRTSKPLVGRWPIPRRLYRHLWQTSNDSYPSVVRRRFSVLVDHPALPRGRGKRGDPERGDPIALLAQHFETEAMKAEGLTRLGYRARLVNHEAGHSRGFVVGQIPANRSIELTDRGGSIDHDRAITLFAHAQHRNIVLIANIANNLLDDV